MISTFRKTLPRRVALSLISGALVGMALPPWGWWPLAIIGIAIFFAISNSVSRIAESFGLATVFAGSWLALGMGWMWWLTAPGYVVTTLLFASWHGFAAMIAHRLGSTTFSRPLTHSLVETLRLSLPFGGVPLATLPIAISPTRLADIVAIGGPVLATWFVFQFGALLSGYFDRSESRSKLATIFATLLMLQIFGQLVTSLNQSTSINKTLRVAFVQGGGPQGILAIHAKARDSVDRHLEVTNTLLESDRIDAVVWPENVIDVANFKSSKEFTEIVAHAKRLNSIFVVGITEDAGHKQFTNAQVVVTPGGEITSRYDKVRRVPFGEYIPKGMRSALEAIGAPMNRIPSDAVAGKDPGLLEIGGVEVGVVISWESFFSGRANSGIEAGGTILFNPTNGSSYTGTILQTQQIATNSLRARETSRWVVQCATTGFSAVINPDGQILDRVGVGLAKATIVDIPLRTGRTWYSYFGDAPFILGLLIGLACCWFVRLSNAKRP